MTLEPNAIPLTETVRLQPAPTTRATASTIWGALPLLTLVAADGLFTIAIANRLAYLQVEWAQVVFWIGFLALVLPISVRLASAQPTRQERIGLLLMLGMGLYMIKVLHSPFAFTLSDERLHLFNANAILQNQRLFTENSVLPVSAFYPGLENVTTALASVTGLSVFDAGRLVIGAARLVIVGALFLSYEQLTRSARLAGLAALLYMANSNFLFWSAQFSYESLALPLAVMVLCAVLRWMKTESRRERIALSLLILITLSAIVVTHHITSYALAGFLALISLGTLILARDRLRVPWLFALFGFAAALVWLVLVSSVTANYLYQIFSRAFVTIPALILGEETGRALFNSNAGSVAPLWERVVGITSIAVLVVGLPIGLVQLVRRYRDNPVALLLGVAGLAYLGVLGLRFVPAGWEVANRASEFLYLGVGLVLALAWLAILEYKRTGMLGRAALAGCCAIFFVGGVVAGWSANLRLSQPYQIEAGATTIPPQGLNAALWARTFLGAGQRMAADQTNALFMLANGDQYVFTGTAHGTRDLIDAPQLGKNQRQVIQDLGVDYVVVDKRLIGWEAMLGLYWHDTHNPAYPKGLLLDPAALEKFDAAPGVNRILDTGDIVIFDVSELDENTNGQ